MTAIEKLTDVGDDMKVYIVKCSIGDYEDHDVLNVGVYSTEDKAIEITRKLNALREYKNNFSKRFWEEFVPAYKASNPEPCIPSWAPGSSAISIEYHKLMEKAGCEWKDNNFSPPLELLDVIGLVDEGHGHTDEFSYEEMEVQ